MTHASTAGTAGITATARAAEATSAEGLHCRAGHATVAACARCGAFHCPECTGAGELALCLPCLAAEGGAETVRLAGRPIGLAELGADLVLAPDRAIERLRRGRVTLALWLGPAALPLLGVALLGPHAPFSLRAPYPAFAPERMLTAGLVLAPFMGVAFHLLFASLAATLLRLLGAHLEDRTARAALAGSLLPSTLLLPVAAGLRGILPPEADLARALAATIAAGGVAWSLLLAVATLALATRTGGEAAGPARPLGPLRAALGIGSALLATGAAIALGAALGGSVFR